MTLTETTLSPLQAVEALMHRLCGLGPLSPMAREHLRSGGRRTRAKLALGAAEALEVQNAVPWAAACELLHNATLVHDDLQDGDRVRRGHPTVWAQHGMAQAINTGDLLLMLPFMAVAQQPATPEQSAALSEVLARRAVLCVQGQALDLDLPEQRVWRMEDWIQAAIGKSGQLLALPVEGAAILAGRADAAALGEHFAEAGALYQLVDDLVDLYGEKGRDERGCDLREGKVSALVIRHLELAPADRDWLRAVLAAPRDETRAEDIERAAQRFEASGAVDSLMEDIAQRRDALDDPTLPEGLRRIAQALALRCTRDLETLR